MQESYSEKEIHDLIEEALSLDSNPVYPKSGLHLGFAETKAFEILSDSLQSKYAYSEIASAFQDAREVLVKEKVSYTIKDLHTQVLNCRKCKNFNPSPKLPMWNSENPEVVFVMEYPLYDKSTAEYFLKVLKDSGYTSSQVCLTYLNRCDYPKRKFDHQEVYNCSPYLHYEIQLLNPKLIVCLGSLPATIIFGKEMPIKDYRSKMIWLGSWPIVITYSPAHVLRAGESFQESFSNDILYSNSLIKKKE